MNIGLDNTADAYLHPDTMLPEQFGDLFRPTERTPEQRLYLAVLEDALHCWLGAPAALRSDLWASKRLKLAYEADRWLFGGGAGAPVSFEACCGAVGIDGAWLREKLRRMADGGGGRSRRLSRPGAGRCGKVRLNERFAMKEKAYA